MRSWQCYYGNTKISRKKNLLCSLHHRTIHFWNNSLITIFAKTFIIFTCYHAFVFVCQTFVHANTEIYKIFSVQCNLQLIYNILSKKDYIILYYIFGVILEIFKHEYVKVKIQKIYLLYYYFIFSEYLCFFTAATAYLSITQKFSKKDNAY